MCASTPVGSAEMHRRAFRTRQAASLRTGRCSPTRGFSARCGFVSDRRHNGTDARASPPLGRSKPAPLEASEGASRFAVALCQLGDTTGQMPEPHTGSRRGFVSARRHNERRIGDTVPGWFCVPLHSPRHADRLPELTVCVSFLLGALSVTVTVPRNNTPRCQQANRLRSRKGLASCV